MAAKFEHHQYELPLPIPPPLYDFGTAAVSNSKIGERDVRLELEALARQAERIAARLKALAGN